LIALAPESLLIGLFVQLRNGANYLIVATGNKDGINSLNTGVVAFTDQGAPLPLHRTFVQLCMDCFSHSVQKKKNVLSGSKRSSQQHSVC
jgi:hypothetical protein